MAVTEHFATTVPIAQMRRLRKQTLGRSRGSPGPPAPAPRALALWAVPGDLVDELGGHVQSRVPAGSAGGIQKVN